LGQSAIAWILSHAGSPAQRRISGQGRAMGLAFPGPDLGAKKGAFDLAFSIIS
jgi:hypothetical protein